jgi:hypothetical protein
MELNLCHFPNMFHRFGVLGQENGVMKLDAVTQGSAVLSHS